MTEIEIPNTVTHIGIYVFRSCNKLAAIDIPSSVDSIGDEQFSNGNLKISEGVTSIASDYYSHYGAINSVTIPIDVTVIGPNAFKGCRDLTDVYYEGSQADWYDINKTGNDWLENATIHFNSSGPSTLDIADKEAAVLVEGKITAIGTVEYTETCKGKIIDARTAYDALTETQKGMVSNYATLTAAETEYAKLDFANTDQKAATSVENSIKAIGTVAYSLECKAKIDTARAEYDGLTETQKLLVSNTDTLLAAEREYQALKFAADQDASDKEAADIVIDKINAIGTVEYTNTCKLNIDSARTAYDNLNYTQKKLVSNAETLDAAEAEYARLKQEAADKIAADAVVNKIKNIGNVVYTDTCKSKIDVAREEYDKLTDSQKLLVSNYADLTKAEETYAGFAEAEAQALIDATKADAVIEKIKAIGTIEYSNECKAKIDAARTSYDDLTDTQKSMVNNYATLTTAEKQYEELENAIIKTKEDMEFANEVIEKIEKIGEVTYSNASKAKIDAARTAYEILSDDQKELVINYDVLTAAEEKYTELKDAEAATLADAIAADEVIEKIKAIGVVSDTEESKAKIEVARDAYDKLTDDQKKLVANYAVLTVAEATYKSYSETTTIPVTAVELNKTTLSSEIGKTFELTATIKPADATDKKITWSSSNDKIAKVDENGVVTMVAVGTATITVTTEDGKITAECAVVVNKTQDSQEAVTSFVDRMYDKCLSREADSNGETYWVDQLTSGSLTGAQVAEQFVFSLEANQKNLSEEEFITLLYNAMMDRNPDAGGMKYWLNNMANGMTRYEVLDGFIQSSEFDGICSTYKITRGTLNMDTVNIEKFVMRMYNKSLERDAEQEGIYYWTFRLRNHEENGATFADKVFFSDEMNKKNLDDDKFVELLYNAMMDRPSDEGGMAYWMNNIFNGMTRKQVLSGFINSAEFTGICKDYGIERGSL